MIIGKTKNGERLHVILETLTSIPQKHQHNTLVNANLVNNKSYVKLLKRGKIFHSHNLMTNHKLLRSK